MSDEATMPEMPATTEAPAEGAAREPTPEELEAARESARTGAWAQHFIRARRAADLAAGFTVEQPDGERVRIQVTHNDRQSYAFEAILTALEASSMRQEQILHMLNATAGALQHIAGLLDKAMAGPVVAPPRGILPFRRG